MPSGGIIQEYWERGFPRVCIHRFSRQTGTAYYVREYNKLRTNLVSGYKTAVVERLPT